MSTTGDFTNDTDGECEVYEEEDDCTDNEEEVMHDLVECTKCGTKTHYSVGECGSCGEKFKMSKAGYILTGEDGAFIVDEDEDIDCEQSSAMEEDEFESSDSDDSDNDDDDEHMFCLEDDDTEYVSKGVPTVDVSAPRRVTRSLARQMNN